MFNPSKQFDNLPQIPGQCVLYSRFLSNLMKNYQYRDPLSDWRGAKYF